MLLIKASARFPDLVQRAELEANIEVVAEVDGFRKGLLQSVSRTVVGGAGTRWATTPPLPVCVSFDTCVAAPPPPFCPSGKERAFRGQPRRMYEVPLGTLTVTAHYLGN